MRSRIWINLLELIRKNTLRYFFLYIAIIAISTSLIGTLSAVSPLLMQTQRRRTITERGGIFFGLVLSSGLGNIQRTTPTYLYFLNHKQSRTLFFLGKFFAGSFLLTLFFCFSFLGYIIFFQAIPGIGSLLLLFECLLILSLAHFMIIIINKILGVITTLGIFFISLLIPSYYYISLKSPGGNILVDNLFTVLYYILPPFTLLHEMGTSQIQMSEFLLIIVQCILYVVLLCILSIVSLKHKYL